MLFLHQQHVVTFLAFSVLCRAAELKYGTLMELQKQLKTTESSLAQKAGGNGSRLLKEEVTEADIAEIISKWTGPL